MILDYVNLENSWSHWHYFKARWFETDGSASSRQPVLAIKWLSRRGLTSSIGKWEAWDETSRQAADSRLICMSNWPHLNNINVNITQITSNHVCFKLFEWIYCMWLVILSKCVLLCVRHFSKQTNESSFCPLTVATLLTFILAGSLVFLQQSCLPTLMNISSTVHYCKCGIKTAFAPQCWESSRISCISQHQIIDTSAPGACTGHIIMHGLSSWTISMEFKEAVYHVFQKSSSSFVRVSSTVGLFCIISWAL